MIDPDVADFIKALARANATRDIEIWRSERRRKAMRPNNRECTALQRLSLGMVEDRRDLPGIGARTISAMLAKGWIEEATDPKCGTVGVRITQAGKIILKDCC